MRIKRINGIKEYLTKNKSASLQDLCKIFNVSMNTIRRDIEQLERENFISKVYGGIVLNDESEIVPLRKRSHANKDAKDTICKIASSVLAPGSTIYIDSGTTTTPLLQYIKPDMNITIISNSLNIHNEAVKYPYLNVISLGGLLSYSTNSFIGISTIENLKNYNINQAFMGCTAINSSHGATNNSYHESEIKKAVIKASGEIILLADSSKVGTSASLSFANLDDIDYFVTDKKPDSDFINNAEGHKVKLLTP